MGDVHEQIRTAAEIAGWTITELLERSGLRIDRASLSRMLHGKQRMHTDEAQQLVSTLRRHGVKARLVWPPLQRRAA